MLRNTTCLLLTIVLAGCGPQGMQRLDRQVGAMIQEHERASLGSAAALDGQPVPQRAADIGLSSRSYRNQPATTNPGPGDLPATAAPPQPPPALENDPAEDAADMLEPPPPLANALHLNLEQALTYAIGHSRDYRSRKEDLFLTALNLLIEKHLWGPRFFDTFTTAVSGTPERGDHDQVLSLVNELGVTQRLPYGGQVSASALVNYVNELRLASGSPTDAQSGELRLSADIPLLRGAGLVAREDLIQAQREMVYAVRDFERFRRSFLVDVATNYYSLLQDQSQIVNQAQQLKNLIWLSKRTEALANAGRVPFFEVQRTQQQVLFARNNLVNARERYETSLDSFKIVLGIATTTPIVVEPMEIQVPAPSLESQTAVKTALQLRLDLQTSRDLIDDAKRRVEIARNNLLPDVNLFADLNLPTDPGKQRSGFDLDAGTGRYSAGVTVGVPLDRRIENLQYRQSLVSMERAQRNNSLFGDQVALQVRRSVRQIALARSTLDLQNRNIELAQTRLRGVELRLSTLGPRDFIEAQDDLLAALDARDSALRNLRSAVLQYLLDTGQMRVTPQGQWLPPAKLAPPQLQKGMPDARDLIERVKAQIGDKGLQ